MRECVETITVFNKVFNISTGYDDWIPTVLSGVSIHIVMMSDVNEHGLTAANKATIRIPDTVESNSVYVDSKQYDKAESVTGLYTLKEGDVIVKAVVTESMKPEQLKENYSDVYTVLSVTDNLSRPHGKHIKVVCR